MAHSSAGGASREELERLGMSAPEVLSIIDNTILDTTRTVEEIVEFAKRSGELGFCAVAVNSALVKEIAPTLRNSGTKVCSAIGFPLGASSTFCKAAEIRDALAAGAEEVDFVSNINLVKSGSWDRLTDEARRLVDVAEGRVTKMILETALLTHSEKLHLCDLAMESGVTFVKTCTGFNGGTTPEEVRSLKGHVGELCEVKATGGIRTLSDVVAMVDAGASRIGTSKGFEIAERLTEL